MISVFVAILSSTLMLVIGLVVDGGAARAARADALDEAASAARAASQNIDVTALHRNRAIVLDEAEARKAVAGFMAATGDRATVTIRQASFAPGSSAGGSAPTEVTVTVTRTVPAQFMWTVGIDSFTETASATVTPEPGRAP